MIKLNKELYFKNLGFTKLNEIQSKVLNINKSKNVLILGSCGSGKTETAHSILLDWNSKSIFCLPMRTLATSIYDRLNQYHDKLGLENWTIQHSSLSEDKFLQNKYCVTTIDQVLSGYLGIGKQAIMKGKNVITSNIVFDEVQLFDTDKSLLTTINMLDELFKLDRKFVIMTATMPSYLINFLKDRYDMEVIINEEETIKDRQVNLYFKNELDIEKIESRKDKQIIICNTRKQQNEIYNQIEGKQRIIILNSKLLKRDREKIERKLKTYFGKGSGDNNKILISTQVIEAGMDISADYLYSANCVIDSLIQRVGRCARWGGNGEVIVFETDDKVYNKSLVENTNDKVIKNDGINFSWKIQKEWINDILNPFYENQINKKSLKINKLNFKIYSREKLIRDIENINLIVDNKPNINSFKRESISIHISELKNISKYNKLYILKQREMKEVKYSNIGIGNTVVIEGQNCYYDELGFRFEKDLLCNTFPEEDDSKYIFEDYVEETWIHHAIDVRDNMNKELKKCYFNEYIKDNIEYISNICGLHDLGKMDVEWLPKEYNIPMAHFPYKKNKRINLHRNHAHISATILRPYIDKILYNVIIQHHKRLNLDNGKIIGINEYKLHNKYKDILHEYGFTKEIKYSDKSIHIDFNDIITPSSKDWTTVLYLTGLLMEVEIESIKNYITYIKELK